MGKLFQMHVMSVPTIFLESVHFFQLFQFVEKELSIAVKL